MHRFEILVVCLGNVCRSPLAERVLRMRFDELLGDLSDRVEVSSAGVLALADAAMDPTAAAELRRLGGDASKFRSKQLTESMVVDANLILTVSSNLQARVLEAVPRAFRRTFTIRELATLISMPALRDEVFGNGSSFIKEVAARRGSTRMAPYDVADPIGQSAAVHRQVADVLDSDCTCIARALTAPLLTDVEPR